MKSNKDRIADPKSNIKLQLAALWTSVMFCYVYGDYFSLHIPGIVMEYNAGKGLLNNAYKLFGASVLMVIPSLMISFSILMKARYNRVLNIFFGIAYTAIMILIAFTTSAPGWAFYIFLAILESILTAIIVWKAIKWPREN